MRPFCWSLHAIPESDSLPWWHWSAWIQTWSWRRVSWGQSSWRKRCGERPQCSFEEAVCLLDMFVIVQSTTIQQKFRGFHHSSSISCPFCLYISIYLKLKIYFIFTQNSLSPLYSFFLFEKFTAAECSKETIPHNQMNSILAGILQLFPDDDDMIPELQIQQCPQKSEGKGRYMCSLINNLKIP